MSTINCPACSAANNAGAQRCSSCSAELNRSESADGTLSCAMGTSEDLGYLVAERHRHSWMASKALISAALMSVIRATLMPYLITKSPPGTFGQIDPQIVEITGFFMMVVFSVAAFYAMEKPLIAVAAAFFIYLAISTPDLVQGSGFLGKGIISKFVMVLLLGRALIAGLQHFMLDRISV